VLCGDGRRHLHLGDRRGLRCDSRLRLRWFHLHLGSHRGLRSDGRLFLGRRRRRLAEEEHANEKPENGNSHSGSGDQLDVGLRQNQERKQVLDEKDFDHGRPRITAARKRGRRRAKPRDG
jgi:hypothetical protein